MIVALPAATPWTTPAELTVATLVLLEDHETALFVALDGSIVGTKVTSLSTAIVAFSYKETFVTETVSTTSKVLMLSLDGIA